MSKQPQLPLAESVKKKLTTEQKVRLNQLIDEFSKIGKTENLFYRFNCESMENLDTPITQREQYIDYVAKFGLTDADLPILKVMLESEKLYFNKDENKNLVNLHVAIAISQLGHEDGVALLINQIYKRETFDDDWIGELYPFVLANFGEKMFGYAKQAYPLSKETYVRGVLGEAIKYVGIQQSALKPQAIELIVELLGNFSQQEKDDNALLINDLCELKAIEQLPLIKQAFDANKVDLSHMGDYEEVEIIMGVRTERSTPKPDFWDEEDRERFEAFQYMTELLAEETFTHPNKSKTSPIINMIKNTSTTK